MEYYLAIKRNEVLLHDITWINLKNIMLRSQSQRTTNYIFHLCEKSIKGKYLEIRLVVVLGWEVGVIEEL